MLIFSKIQPPSYFPYASVTSQGKTPLVHAIILMCRQKGEGMTHNDLELEPEVTSTNPAVDLGPFNTYKRGWALRNGHSVMPMLGELYIRCRKSRDSPYLLPTVIYFCLLKLSGFRYNNFCFFHFYNIYFALTMTPTPNVLPR